MSDAFMQILAGSLSLLIGAAGWYYLFYSRAAQGLSGVEQERVNLRRVRLRRVGGCVMILLAIVFYVCCVALIRRQIRLFAGTMFGVLLLMGTILVLGLMDLRMTRNLRRRAHRDGDDPDRPRPRG